MKVAPCPRCGGPPVSYCYGCFRYTDDVDLADPVVTPGSDPRSEQEIRRDIVGFLRALGYRVWDHEQGYRKDGSTRVTKGFPDLIVAGHGRIVAAEIKSARGKLTPEQQEFRDTWVENGGEHVVWRSVGDARTWHETVERAA